MMRCIALLGLLLLLRSSCFARAVRPAFLITPGKSIGKISIGENRKSIHRKMSKPYRTQEKIKVEHALDFWDYPSISEWKEALRKSSRTITVDTWRRSKTYGVLNVIYVKDRVIQISVSLPGYATSDGLTIGSTLTEFGKKYKTPKIYTYVIEPDEVLGLSAWIQDLADYVTVGLAIVTRTYTGPSNPWDVEADTIIVHPVGSPVFNWF